VADAAFDLVADRADVRDVYACRAGQVPVFVAAAGEDGAGVAAAHGDDDVGGADDLVGPRLGVLAGDVDAALGHRRDGRRVDPAGRVGAAGPGDRVVGGEVGEEPQGHL
jgi:hypothetical protein